MYCASKCFWFLAHIELKKTIPLLSFWWLFNRIQAKLVIRYQLSFIGYQLLLLQQNCSTCFYLLLSVLLLLFSIFLLLLLLLTTIIQLLLIMILLVIWCHLMVIWQKKIICSAHYLRLFTNRWFIMEYELCSFIGPAMLKALLQQHSGFYLKENLQFWLSDPLSTTVCKLAVMWKISCLTPFSDNQGPEISCSWKAWGFWQRSGLNLSPNVHGL